MRTKVRRDSTQTELAVAIGLVWGHLNASQFEEAYKLARGCLRVWPQEHRLILMSAYAAVELLVPLDDTAVKVLETTQCREWADLIRQRIPIDTAISADAGMAESASC